LHALVPAAGGAPWAVVAGAPQAACAAVCEHYRAGANRRRHAPGPCAGTNDAGRRCRRRRGRARRAGNVGTRARPSRQANRCVLGAFGESIAGGLCKCRHRGDESILGLSLEGRLAVVLAWRFTPVVGTGDGPALAVSAAVALRPASARRSASASRMPGEAARYQSLSRCLAIARSAVADALGFFWPAAPALA